MLESIRLVRTYTGKLSKEDFLASFQVQDAVIRRIEIIGEAVKNIPAEFSERHSAVWWRQIAGMSQVDPIIRTAVRLK